MKLFGIEFVRWVGIHIAVVRNCHLVCLFVLRWACSCWGWPVLILWEKDSYIGWVGFHNGCLHLSGECLYWDKSVFVMGISIGMGGSYW